MSLISVLSHSPIKKVSLRQKLLLKVVVLLLRIIKRAKESGIYAHESKELVALLMRVNLDDRIPSQLYVAIAELLAWLYHLKKSDTKPLLKSCP